MNTIILKAEELSLPIPLDDKIKSKKVKITESGNSIIITPISNAVTVARGMLKGGNFNAEKLMEQKEED